MYLFKTSGKTFDSVISNQKHAFKNQPRDWYLGEMVLVSKNKKDLKEGEAQISYTMVLDSIRKTTDKEIEFFWPGNRGGWNYIVDCKKTKKLKNPFNLEEIIGREAENYRPVVTFKKIQTNHEHLIANYLPLIIDNNTDSIPLKHNYYEGSVNSIRVNAYERDPNARKACIEHYGVKCKVCKFDFKKFYGNLGRDYIQVHHVVPLSSIRKEYKVNPIKDLIPLCANCHAMIHRKNPALSINELKSFIKKH